MKTEQQDFDSKVNDIGAKVTGFTTFIKMDDYEDVANQARDTKKKLDDAVEMAKQYNNREVLTGSDETNYDNITQTVKEFEPFYNLWTTTDLWKKSHHSWLNDSFD